MNTVIKIGVLNVFRNKRRSFLTSLAIAVGLLALILANGLILGTKNYMINSVTEDFLGHAQIHHKEFVKKHKTKFVLEETTQLKREILNDSFIKAYSLRTFSPALIASAEGSHQIALFGIIPESEKEVSRISKFITSGTYLGNDPKSILLGSRLAKKLNVAIGDKVVVTVSTLKSENISQELLRVGGIFTFSSREFDNNFAFINSQKMQSMLGCKECFHEIVLKFRDLEKLDLQQQKYKSQFSRESSIFRDWRELSPALNSAFKLNDISLILMIFLLAVLVGAGIINTLYMSLFERKYEFGVLLAIGTRKSTLFKIVIIESISLAIMSIILGSILTGIFGTPLALYGIDYGGISFAGVSLREPIYFIFNLKAFLLFSIGLIIFTILVSIYPLIKLLKTHISDSLKIM